MPESAPTRESELEARAAKVGHRLYPPSAENWVIVDEAGNEPGWSTSGDSTSSRSTSTPSKSAENWVIVDEAGEEPGWSTSGDLDELEEYIDAVERS